MSYATLLADVELWLHRDDLSAVIPTFVSFAEAKFNERLRHRSMETEFAEVALVNSEALLPTDFKGFKYLVSTTDPEQPLKLVTLEFLKSQQANTSRARYYAIDGSIIVCYPSGGSVKGVYYAKIPSLETASTNWLDDYRHDLYVYETLSHACMYIKDVASSKMYEAKSDAIIREITNSDKADTWSGSTMVVKAR